MSATRPTRGYYRLSILNYIGTNTIVLPIPTRRSRKAKISIRFICDHTRLCVPVRIIRGQHTRGRYKSRFRFYINDINVPILYYTVCTRYTRGEEFAAESQ